MALVIYTKPGCPYCQQARDYYNSKGITFIDHDAQTHRELRQDDHLKEPLPHPHSCKKRGSNTLLPLSASGRELGRGFQ